MKTLNFTVAIRAYNAGDRLPLLLDALQKQHYLDHLCWEVLVVDNHSTDHTAAIVQSYQQSWQGTSKLRYCLETEQGAAIARRRAVQEAKGEWIGFLDDDNVPDQNWVATAWAFAQTHPQVGAFGGQIHGVFAVEPPPDFHRISPFLALFERSETFCYNFERNGQPRRKVLPPGAGLVIRRQSWLESVPPHLALRGPVGTALTSKGEDMQALMYLDRAGWEIWNHPDLHLYHHIPAWRLEQGYLVRLCQGVGLGKYPLRMMHYPAWQHPLVVWGYWLNDLQRAVRYYCKHRRALRANQLQRQQCPTAFWSEQTGSEQTGSGLTVSEQTGSGLTVSEQTVPNYTVTVCEMALLRYSLISPFYHWRNQA